MLETSIAVWTGFSHPSGAYDQAQNPVELSEWKKLTEKRHHSAWSMETALYMFLQGLAKHFVRFMWNPKYCRLLPDGSRSIATQWPGQTLKQPCLVRSAVLFLLFESAPVMWKGSQGNSSYPKPQKGHQASLQVTSEALIHFLLSCRIEEGRTGESQREEGDFFPAQATKLGDPSFIVLGLSEWSTVARSL